MRRLRFAPGEPNLVAMTRVAGVLAAFLISTSSADARADDPPKPGPPRLAAPGSPRRAPAPPSLEQTAQDILTAIAEQDGEYLEGLLDRRQFMRDIVKQVTDDPTWQNGFVEGALKSFHPFSQFAHQQNTTMAFKGIHERDHQTTLRYRVLAGGGVTFVEFAMKRDPTGAWKAVDIFSGTVGDWSSNIVMRGVLLFTPQSPMKTLLRALGLSSDARGPDLLPKMRRFVGAARNGDVGEVVRAYADLPEDVKKQKWIQGIRLSGVASLDPENPTYQNTVIDVANNFADDPAVSLMVLDGLLFLKRYDDAIRAVRVTNRNYGPDAYLEFLEGNIHSQKGDFDAALKAYDRASALEPSLAGPYYEKVALLVTEKRFKEAARAMKTFQKQFGEPFPSSESAIENWKDFAASKDFPR